MTVEGESNADAASAGRVDGAQGDLGIVWALTDGGTLPGSLVMATGSGMAGSSRGERCGLATAGVELSVSAGNGPWEGSRGGGEDTTGDVSDARPGSMNWPVSGRKLRARSW